jgi:hypothetical protein
MPGVNMTASQTRAVKNHRKRQADKGLIRMDITVPDRDRELLKEIAANLRAGGELADKTRSTLCKVQNPYAGMNFKQFLEAAPIEGLEFERSRETARDIDL